MRYLGIIYLVFMTILAAKAQVIFDNNVLGGISSGVNTGVINMTVPAGNNRLLVMVNGGFVKASGVTFNGQNLIEACSGDSTQIFYLVLGNGPAIMSMVNITYPSATNSSYRAMSFQNIDQLNPFTASIHQGHVNATANTPVIPSAPGNLIVDVINQNLPSAGQEPVAGANQTAFMGPLVNGVRTSLSFEIASGPSTTMGYNWTDPTSGSICVARFNHITVPTTTPIPTLGQWGILILGLLLLLGGILLLKSYQIQLPAGRIH